MRCSARRCDEHAVALVERDRIARAACRGHAEAATAFLPDAVVRPLPMRRRRRRTA